MTITERYERAASATSEEEARHVFEFCVSVCMETGRTREDAEQIERDQLGFYAASYCDDETRERVYRLFSTENPIERRRRSRASEAAAFA